MKGISLHDFKTYYKETVIETTGRDRGIDQWFRREFQSLIHKMWIVDKGTKVI